MDPVNAVLQDLRISGSTWCWSELNAPWGFDFPAKDWVSFHYLAKGRCCLITARETVALEAGDFFLLAQGTVHALADAPDTPRTPIGRAPCQPLSPNVSRLVVAGPGPASTLVCGGAHFSGSAAHPLLQHLPTIFVVRKAQLDQHDWMRPTLEAITLELDSPRPGVAAALMRLADLLVIQAIRNWIESASADPWLAALRDPGIGRSLAVMHISPDKAWDLDSLAREIGMSRSVFAERFASLVGQPPKQYLTAWRMHLASGWLKEERLSLAQVALRLGYGSEAAFSRAFKRHFGQSPGSHRQGAS